MAALSDSVITREGLNPKLRFKVAVSIVIYNLPWLKDNDFMLTPTDPFGLKLKEVLTEAKKISVFHKLIFLKQPDQRTQFELQSLKWIFALGFKFFKFCPKEIQIAIIKRASYNTYGPGRWILKEGHSPKKMYMIVKGHVRITETVHNKVFNTLDIIEYCKLGEKKSFGESTVMFDSRRTTSVQSLDTVELITISKSNFMDTTKDNLKLQWNKNAMAIKNSSYFKHLTLMELNKCSIVSFIKKFTKYESVLGERIGYHDHAYFVIEGEISLVFQKIFKKSNNPPNVKSKYPSSTRSNNKIYKYVDTCTFLSDSYFNIGENMKGKVFLANEFAKCLCVPHWYMKKTEKLKNWMFAKLDIERIIPKKHEVFKVMHHAL